MNKRRKSPPVEDALLCIELRCKKARKEKFTDEDFVFCETLKGEYGEWYKKTEAIIYNCTNPLALIKEYEQENNMGDQK